MKIIKSTFYLYLLILILIFSCGMPTDNEENQTGSFFPLKVGNRWHYRSSWSYGKSINEIWEIIGKTELDNRIYYEFVISDSLPVPRDTVYYRMNGDTLFSKNINEYIVADFSLQLNDTAYWQSDLKVISKSDSIIEYSTPFYPDYGFSITFKKNLGMINEVRNGYVYYSRILIKAEIK